MELELTKQRAPLWRVFTRVVLETLVIAAGVIAGLAADEWRQERADRSLSAGFLSRLQRDLETDTAAWTFASVAASQKVAALDRALFWVRSPDLSPSGVSAFLDDLTIGSRMAYGALTSVEQTTFDELVNSGRLDLIGDASLRRAAMAYYYQVALDRTRVNSRETDYAPTVYELIPRDPEFVVAEQLTDSDKLRIAQRALERDLEGLIIAERNRGRLRAEVAVEQHRAASELLFMFPGN
jgi:hypothetical protein